MQSQARILVLNEAYLNNILKHVITVDEMKTLLGICMEANKTHSIAEFVFKLIQSAAELNVEQNEPEPAEVEPKVAPLLDRLLSTTDKDKLVDWVYSPFDVKYSASFFETLVSDLYIEVMEFDSTKTFGKDDYQDLIKCLKLLLETVRGQCNPFSLQEIDVQILVNDPQNQRLLCFNQY